MSNSFFDAEAFYSALDSYRLAKKKNWKKVANESGVSPSTLTRMGQGRRPDIDSLAALATWSKLDVSKFYKTNLDEVSKPEPLAEITTLLRADRNLSSDGAAALEAMIKSAYEHMREKENKT
ncbi:helix-turn-helix domain-containing protein [Amylibacter sp. IMCC11727]|uniref:helix-turn-helix domain-containing protein n=1 Tax=Amylibacter sp. IMCC11727 TaxID=3039851 RepID=UPI00244DBDC9|nr:helix-turn-helix domain-containing protein [Amylibacter sp. IMCC11727]WGI21174.1 helix-turn-helix domain-containing protein [Amylibacter sp. IMCC11727]